MKTATFAAPFMARHRAAYQDPDAPGRVFAGPESMRYEPELTFASQVRARWR